MFYGHMSRENWFLGDPSDAFPDGAPVVDDHMIIYPMMVTYDMKFMCWCNSATHGKRRGCPGPAVPGHNFGAAPPCCPWCIQLYSAPIVALFFLLIGFAF